MKFNSIPEAIDNRGSYLKRMYFDQGQTTLPAIWDGWNGKQWNPDIGHTPFYPSTHRAASLNPIAQRGAGCPPAGRQAARPPAGRLPARRQAGCLKKEISIFHRVRDSYARMPAK